MSTSLGTEVMQHAATLRTSAALRHAITLGGRRSLEDGLEALEPVERLAAEILLRTTARPEDAAAFVGGITIDASARVRLRTPGAVRNDESADDSLFEVRLSWDAESYDEFLASCFGVRQQMQDCDRRALRILQTLSLAERETFRMDLRSALLHMAPLNLWCRGVTYNSLRAPHTVTGGDLSLSSRRCLFTQIDLEQLAAHDAQILASLYLIVRAGGWHAIEAYNGTALDLNLVEVRMRATIANYTGDHTIAEGVELADQLHQVIDEQRRESQPYREILGVTLNKREKYFVPSARSFIADAAGALFHTHVETVDEVRAAASVAAEATACGQLGAELQRTLFSLVERTRERTESDVAMTRGVRDLTTLQSLLVEERYEEIADWELPAYYCAVTPSPSMAEAHVSQPGRLADILWSISARMQFNSWHFLPACLPAPGSIRDDYFEPPRMPDISRWSDQHHSGHVSAHVRFAVRAPRPLTVANRTLHGAVDVRLMRQRGPEFGIDELQMAWAAAEAIQAVVESYLAVANERNEVLVIDAFDHDWYARQFISSAQGAQ